MFSLEDQDMDAAPAIDGKESDQAYRDGQITELGFRYVKHLRGLRCLYFALLRLAKECGISPPVRSRACKQILTEFLA